MLWHQHQQTMAVVIPNAQSADVLTVGLGFGRFSCCGTIAASPDEHSGGGRERERGWALGGLVCVRAVHPSWVFFHIC